MRKIVLALVTVMIFLTSPGMVSAEESEKTFQCGKPLYSEELDKEISDFAKNDANMAEKFLVGQTQNLFNIGGINSLSGVVFGNPYCVWAGKETEMSSDGIFTKEERDKIIDPIIKIFSGVYVTLLVLAMMASGLKLSFGSVRGQAIADFWDDAKMWIMSGLFIAAYFPITSLVFELNAGVVLAFKDLLESQGVKSDGFSIMAHHSDFTGSGGAIPVISLIVVVLAEWILAIILNVVYVARKVIILVLLVVGFVAAYSLLFARMRSFFGVWVKELIGNVFLQSIHALILFAFAMMASMGAGVIYKLALMMMFIPLTGIISRWLKLGDDSSRLGSTLTMMGLGGLMTTYMITRQAGNVLRGGNINGTANLRNEMNSDGGITSLGGGTDASMTNISASATGMNSNSWQSTKDMLSNVGGAVFGTAGAVAGPAGAAAMYGLGSKLTGVAAQGARNVLSGGYNAFQTVRSGMKYAGADGSSGFGAMWGNLSARRSFMGDLGESLGSVVGLGVRGRGVGQALSGVSRQRLMASSPEIGGRGMTDAKGSVIPPSFQSLQQQYPGAELRYMQTNRESGFYMKNPNTNSWQPVGAPGAADSTLKSGMARVMDYKLPENPSAFELQSNGSYRFTNESGQSSTAGLQGSNDHLMRTSNAYIVGTGSNTGRVNEAMAAQVASESTVRYEDQSFDASRVNPDSYIAHNISGADTRTRSDKVADRVYQYTEGRRNQTKGWSQQFQQSNRSRNKKIL